MGVVAQACKRLTQKNCEVKAILGYITWNKTTDRNEDRFRGLMRRLVWIFSAKGNGNWDELRLNYTNSFYVRVCFDAVGIVNGYACHLSGLSSPICKKSSSCVSLVKSTSSIFQNTLGVSNWIYILFCYIPAHYAQLEPKLNILYC